MLSERMRAQKLYIVRTVDTEITAVSYPSLGCALVETDRIAEAAALDSRLSVGPWAAVGEREGDQSV